eukprot:12726545-Heterocapsa_arctica.AAC.1
MAGLEVRLQERHVPPRDHAVPRPPGEDQPADRHQPVHRPREVPGRAAAYGARYLPGQRPCE